MSKGRNYAFSAASVSGNSPAQNWIKQSDLTFKQTHWQNGQKTPSHTVYFSEGGKAKHQTWLCLCACLDITPDVSSAYITATRGNSPAWRNRYHRFLTRYPSAVCPHHCFFTDNSTSCKAAVNFLPECSSCCSLVVGTLNNTKQ